MNFKIFFEKLLFRIYPPYLGAGIRVKKISPDYREVTVEMKLRFWNRNYVNTHFGGSLYAMTDPFFMIMLMKNLGAGYIVWDKSAAINFLKPGKGTMRAEFRITEADIAAIKKETAGNVKTEPVFKIEVKDPAGETVALVEKRLYVRKKQK